MIDLEQQILRLVELRGRLPPRQSYEVPPILVLKTPLSLVGPISTPPPCSPIPANFPGFVHVLWTYLGKLKTLLERLLWSLGEMACPQGP